MAIVRGFARYSIDSLALVSLLLLVGTAWLWSLDKGDLTCGNWCAWMDGGKLDISLMLPPDDLAAWSWQGAGITVKRFGSVTAVHMSFEVPLALALAVLSVLPVVRLTWACVRFAKQRAARVRGFEVRVAAPPD
jgi:hypothetical protein